MFAKFGWLSSFKPLIVPQFFPFFIFLIMQFIRTIPKELDEAAKIDGCDKYGIFFRIVVPLIVPALITCSIFSFYWRWDDFINPLIYLNNPEKYPVSLALKLFLDGSRLITGAACLLWLPYRCAGRHRLLYLPEIYRGRDQHDGIERVIHTDRSK